MKLQNIDRILLFRTEGGTELTLDAMQTKYGFDPDGCNFYYGLVPSNIANFTSTGNALIPSHRAFFNAVLASLTKSPDDEKTVVLGFEPPDADPYGVVSANLPLNQRIGERVSGYPGERACRR